MDREPEALSATINSLFGENAVRRSSDTIANANSAAQGSAIISGRSFGAATRSRLDASGILPTARSRFGEPDPERSDAPTSRKCPKCGGSGKVRG